MSQSPIPDSAPRVLSEWRDRIRAADAAGTALELRGGGTKAFYGQPPRGERFDTRAYRGIVSFEPTELVITARCGTPLAELEAAVAQAGQMLPFESPSFGEQATLGGAMAAGLSGPRRATAGAMRDFVLGASLLDARGQWMRFGGQVMKNVAGYDVSRVLCGSMGILGLITEVSLKVLPVPALETTLTLVADQKQALAWLNQWAGRPVPLSASAWSAGNLVVRLSGAAAAVRAATETFRQRHGAKPLEPAEAKAFWADVREHRAAVLDTAGPLWRLSVPSASPVLAMVGEPFIEWGGALRWYASQAPAASVREAAAAVGGTACLFRGGDKSVGAFHPLTDAVARLHMRLKREFDPNRIFNPGRLYGDL